MKKTKRFLLLILAVSMLITDTDQVHAADRKKLIPDHIDEFCKKTGCNAVSVAIVRGDETEFYGDSEGLYQIGSMTKAFTGLGIQKLINDGVIGEEDNISEWLPGFSAIYGNETCDITIRQLLTQTSGYTNNETDYPGASGKMSLMEWTDSISGKELNFKPGTEYAYSNVNYNLLGAVIECVTGETYKEYMEEEILLPLGLTNTFVYVASENDQIIRGSRLGYHHCFAYDIPVSVGKIPAGYYYSNAEDMARWMRIWMGIADVPQEYIDLVSSVKERLVAAGDYYSGWELFENETVGHSGGTPNYSSRIVFGDKEQTGVCVLTNLNVAASTDGLCNGIYSIVTGGNPDRLPTDVWIVFDRIFTVLSVAGVILLGLAAILKRRGILLGLAGALIIILILLCAVMPIAFGSGLGEIMIIWAPYSFSGGLVILAVDTLAMIIKLWMMRKHEN